MRFIVKYKFQGRIHTKTFRASSQNALESELRKKRFLPLLITPKTSFSFQGSPKSKDLLSAFYELKLGLKAHLPLQVLLENLSAHSQSKALRECFLKALFALNSGKSLALSFKEAGFSDFICAMMLVGQKADMLQDVVELIILRLKNTQKTQKTLAKVLLYPSLVMLMMIVVFLGVTLFVLPQFAILFAGMESDLPFVSQSLLFMRGVVLDFGVLSAMIFCGLGLALFVAYKRVESFRMRVDCMILRIPFLGKVLYDVEMVQFLLSFFWLYRSGIALQEALEIAIKSLHNHALIKKAGGIFNAIVRGVAIQEAFSASAMFGTLGTQILSGVHNEAGFLESLEVLLELYKEELETHSQTLLSSIEPIMILLLGGLILWLALGIFLPLWELPLQMQKV